MNDVVTHRDSAVIALRGDIRPDGIDDLRQRMDALRATLVEIATISEGGLRRRAHKLLAELNDYSASVTLVGQVKAGKTALTNALANLPHLLPSDVNPWTSVVTTLHVNKPPPDGQRAIFDFFAPDEWQKLMQGGGRLGEMARRAQHSEELARLRSQLEAMRAASEARLGHKFEMLMGNRHRFAEFNRDLISRYVCLGDEDGNQKDGQYADVTRSAQLFVTSNAFKVPVSLRDTPGVNDPFLVREQVTLNSLADTDICVIVLSAHQAMTTVDMALLRIIMAMKNEQIILFINRIDELDSPQTQIPEIETSIRDTLRAQGLPEDLQIVFGSAHWAEMDQANRLDEVNPASRAAMAKLTGQAGDAIQDISGQDISGITALRTAIDDKIAQHGGARYLNNISKRARNLTHQAIALLRQAENIGLNTSPTLALNDLDSHMQAMVRRHQLANEKQINAAVFALREKMNSAVEDFITQETKTLARALQTMHGMNAWQINSNALRRYLKSGYDEFAIACDLAITRVYAAAAEDVQTLYATATGTESVRVEPPSPPSVSAPMVLGRTLSIDLGRNWWSRWFSRARQADAIIKDMRGAMARELGPLLDELELEHATTLLVRAAAGLTSFFEEHSETLQHLCALDEQTQATHTRHQLGLPDEAQHSMAVRAKMGGILTRLSLDQPNNLASESGD